MFVGIALGPLHSRRRWCVFPGQRAERIRAASYCPISANPVPDIAR
jgi:hypothetical protein